ncbi:MAG: CoA-binding protein [Verrucomicrobiota bacterium]|nr:CoA-binding protein [Verrucomicrobiota bacterium]
MNFRKVHSFCPAGQQSVRNLRFFDEKCRCRGGVECRNKFGNKAFRGFLQKGYKAFPVHPIETEVEGHPAFRSIRELPERPDIVTIYVAPPVLLKLLPEIAEKGCDELWLNPGTVTQEVLSKATELGLKPVQLCSIIAIGLSPSSL